MLFYQHIGEKVFFRNVDVFQSQLSNRASTKIPSRANRPSQMTYKRITYKRQERFCYPRKNVTGRKKNNIIVTSKTSPGRAVRIKNHLSRARCSTKSPAATWQGAETRRYNNRRERVLSNQERKNSPKKVKPRSCFRLRFAVRPTTNDRIHYNDLLIFHINGAPQKRARAEFFFFNLKIQRKKPVTVKAEQRLYALGAID